jgi:predicted DNA-binding transcriptional regulator AlpA
MESQPSYGANDADQPNPAADDQLLPARAVCDRYRISPMTLWRWLKDPELNFPRPLYVNGRRYFSQRAVRAFDEHQRASARTTGD